MLSWDLFLASKRVYLNMKMDISDKVYENSCRTCLKDGGDEMHDIFELNKDMGSVAEMLSSYTPLRVINETMFYTFYKGIWYHCFCINLNIYIKHISTIINILTVLSQCNNPWYFLR